MNKIMTPVSVLALLLLFSTPLWAAQDVDTGGQDPEVTEPAGMSQPTGKGPGMGHDYQKNAPGPGEGEPEHRGGDDATPETAQDRDNQGKGRAGAGLGEGYPGYRGQGKDGAPHHRQYGSPPRKSAD